MQKHAALGPRTRRGVGILLQNDTGGGTSATTRSVAWTSGEIFQLVREAPEISRSELARQTRLSPTTVASRVESLLNGGYLTEQGTSRAGRKPRALSLNAAWGIVITAHIGSRHTRVCAVDMAGEILTVTEYDQAASTDVEATLLWLHERFEEALTSLPPDRPPLRGIGLSVPAPVDAATGELVGPTLLHSWNRVSLAPSFEEWYGVPVIIDNDATLMARGEHRTARPSVDSLVYLKLGAAIGCGIVVNRNVHRGHSGGAGEIGHMPIRSEFSRPCICGRHDCLEAGFGGAAIIEHLRERGHDISTTAEVVQLVNRADPDALEITRAAGEAMGSAVAVLADFFNPEAIILGGRLSAIEPLTQNLRSALYARALPLAVRDTTISASETAENASCLGAAWTIIDHLFSPQTVNASLSG